MSSYCPKEGTIERIVLEKLVEAGSAGVTYMDFPAFLEITEEVLADVIMRLENGIFESDVDEKLGKDS